MPPGYNLKYVLGTLLIIVLIVLGIYRSRNDNKPQWHELSRMGLHTHVEIKWSSSKKSKAKVLQGIDSIIAQLDQQFSEGAPSHPFYVLSHSPKGTQVTLSSDQKMLLEFFENQTRRKGFSEPNPLQLGAGEWVYRYGLSEDSLEQPFTKDILDSLVRLFRKEYYRYNSNKSQLELLVDSLHLSLGSISKGYGIERIAEYMREMGIQNFLINAGGDMYCSGVNSREGNWIIGIQHPRETPDNPLIGIVEAPPHFNGLATSGDYELFKIIDGKRIHHIINGQTGESVSDKQSITVLAENALKADFFATYLFLLPLTEILDLVNADPQLEVFVVDSSGQGHFSSNMGKYFSN